MKLKILIFIIISGLTFGQTYIKPEIDTLKLKVPSTVPTEVGQVGMFTGSGMRIEKVYTQSQVDNIKSELNIKISDNASLVNQLLQDLELYMAYHDTLAAFVKNLQYSIPPVLTPTAPTFIATGSGVGSVLVSSIVATSITDSIQFEIRDYSAFGDQLPFTTSTKVDSGVGSFTISGLNEGTTYEIRAYTIKTINSERKASSYSLSDTATTLITPPSGGAGTYDYYVSASATGSGDGSDGNEWTIRQAVANAQAGDTVLVEIGEYPINGSTYPNITQSNDGTSGNPIVFVGEYTAGYNPETVDNDSMAWFNCTSATNGQINLNGDYVEWHNIATYQVSGRQTYNIAGDYVIVDSCVIVTDPAVVSEHTFIVKPSSQNGELRNSYLLRSGRCHIYVEADNTSAADNWVMDNNVFKGASEHNSIEYMPLTTANPSQFIYNCVIKNNTFIDNPYSHNILLRHNMNAKIYNNLFINSGYIKFEPHNYGDQTTDTVLVAYNTFVENTDSYVLDNQAMSHVTWYNNLYYYPNGLSQLYLYRIGDVFTGNDIDYNFYYDGDATFNPSITYSSAASYSTTWKATFGFDTHSTSGTAPTFTNAGANIFTPLDGSSPQIGKDTPITTGAGFEIDILYDKNGDLRDRGTVGCFR